MRDEPDPAGTTGSLGQGRKRAVSAAPPLSQFGCWPQKRPPAAAVMSPHYLPFPPPRPETNTPACRWVVTPKGIGDYGSQDERHLPVLMSLLAPEVQLSSSHAAVTWTREPGTAGMLSS